MSDADYIGQQFGSYKIIDFISGGSYGSVFKAKHVHFENDPIVAIKILHSHISSQEERAQFVSEAQLLRKLKHPYILPVIDVGFQNAVLYMIIEYAVGGTLRKRIKKQAGQPFPIAESIKVITQVGEALHYAHLYQQHVVHCDLKPENILFNAKGDALLADFGIATILATTGTKVLGSGGTQGYMAPEQFNGLVSPKIDQYALGCIAYELFAGRHPYNLRGANVDVAEYQHSHVEPATPSIYNPQLPAHIEIAIKKAMAKDRNNRYSNIAAFLAALQQTAFSLPATQPVISQPSTVPVTLPPLVERRSNVLSQTLPNSIEQLFQEGVRARSSGNTEKEFRIWRLIMMTPDVPETYSTSAHNRIQEMRTRMIPLRLKQARVASMQGRWQKEIRMWEDLLALAPSDQGLAPLLKKRPLTLGTYFNSLQSIQQRLQIAQQNEQSAFMYEDVQKLIRQKLIRNKDIDVARTQLQMLWKDAPYYGDPEGLAQTMGLLAAMNYEQAIDAEQERLKQQAEQERVRQEQKRLAQLKQKQEIAKQERNNRILMIVIGTGILLGVVGEVVRVEVAGVVIGAVGVAMTGAMTMGVIAGILAVLAAAVKNEDRVLIGAWVVVLVAGVGGGIVAGVGRVDGLEGRIAYGIIEVGGCAIATVVVYWATVVVYRIAYGIAKVVGAVVALIGEIREKS